MKGCRAHAFFTGMLQGIGLSLMLGLIALYLLADQDMAPSLEAQTSSVQSLMQWVYRNFGWSLLPFAVTLGLYLASLRQLDRRLARNRRKARCDNVQAHLRAGAIDGNAS